MDRRFFVSLLAGLAAILAVASSLVWGVETDRTLGDLGAAFYWSVTTVLGQGDASYVVGPVGWAVGWLLGVFGVAIVATITGALVGFVIDFLLKEGQGMGASGYRDHIVVCGWNTTARDLLDELITDAYEGDVVLIHDSESNPAGSGVYFVRGDATNESDLKRAGIEQARSAIICPVDSSNEADMHSILTALAIESIAPHVRTVVEVNNPAHVPHFRRANADEVLVTSKLASHLLARTAIYPGLSELVTDIVSGGRRIRALPCQPARGVRGHVDRRGFGCAARASLRHTARRFPRRHYLHQSRRRLRPRPGRRPSRGRRIPGDAFSPPQRHGFRGVGQAMPRRRFSSWIRPWAASAMISW